MLNLFVAKPVSAYHITRDNSTGTVKVLYDNKSIIDEEVMYQFNTDGSASSQSLAWGNKTTLPAGTFNDLMLNLPKTEKLTAKIAKQMAYNYDNILAKKTKNNCLYITK